MKWKKLGKSILLLIKGFLLGAFMYYFIATLFQAPPAYSRCVVMQCLPEFWKTIIIGESILLMLIVLLLWSIYGRRKGDENGSSELGA